MVEIEQYLKDRVGFRLTKEMIQKIMEMVDDYGNSEWELGLSKCSS